MEENHLRPLFLRGIYSQASGQAYVMMLQEITGERRLPIVIGHLEAQSIECRLRELIPPRPLTHDLMASTMRAAGLRLIKVILHRLESGVYAADMHVATPRGEELILDARSSDAIAMAIRLDAPILAPDSLLDETAAQVQTTKIKITPRRPRPSEASPAPKPASDLHHLSIPQLQEELQKAVAEEDYERASLLKQEIERRDGQKPGA